jgi:hypothetical protein
MSGSVSNNQAIELFKTVYGNMHDLVPDDQLLAKDIPWDEGSKVGDSFKEDVVLGDEVGITFGGSAQEAFEINPAISGAVRQTEVVPYVSILPSILPFATISRSLGDEKAFFQATKFITQNNLKSHNRLKEVARIYGQSTQGLGTVSYASATYRGVALTNGGGTINGITFTAGINAAGKHILLAPGQFASGHWVGKTGIKVKQVLVSDGSVVASGKLVAVNSKFGYITVDFTPVAASSVGSHKLVYDGWENQGEMTGIQSILSTVGTLFGVDNNRFSLFRGNAVTNGGKKLTLRRVNEYIADAVNGAGLEGELTLYCNPRSWATMSSDEASLRVYDKSYNESQAKNGFMDLEYYSQNGKLTVKSHRGVKEGDAFILSLDCWKRSGSAQVGFKVPGIEGDLIKPLENQAGYQFKSFSDEYCFSYQPGHNIYISGINDESTD